MAPVKIQKLGGTNDGNGHQSNGKGADEIVKEYTIENLSSRPANIIEVDIATICNLRIKVPLARGRELHFKVNDQVLCSASTVFVEMLGENSLSAERTPISATNVESISIPVITLEGGDPVVLRLVFQVLHHKNDSLPDKLAFLEMVKLAIFCEKYGLREALKTWATIWSKAFPLAKMTKPGFEDWLLVLYVFKLPDCLAFSDGLARRLCELKNGQLYVKSECGGKLLNDHLPESVVHYLTEVRACLVGSVRDVMERIQVSYMTHPLCRTSSVCTESYKPKDCDSLQIGDFCQQMYLKRIWHEKFWRQSFSEIVMILISFNKRVLPKRLTRFLDARHSHCSWTGKLKEEIARI